MPGEPAALVLAAWSSAPAGAAVRIVDQPSLLRGPDDLLLEDVFLADRHSEDRFDRGRAAFRSLPVDRFPTEKTDYEATFVMEHADLSQRLDRLREALRRREVASLALPDAEDRFVWAAKAAASERGIPISWYPVVPEARTRGEAWDRRVAKAFLALSHPFLGRGFRTAAPRLLTSDLGLLDTILPHLPGTPGVLSQGLGIVPRLRRRLARYAWIRHPDPRPRPDLRRRDGLEEGALALALSAWPDLPQIVAAAEPWFERKEIDVVVLPDDKSALNSALVRLAKEHRVPSLVVQHGIISHPVGFVPFRADRFAAWGDASAEWLVARGVPREAITVTGNPKYDRPILEREALRLEGRNLFRSRGVDPSGPVAVFLSQPVEARLEAFRMARDAVAGTPWRLVVKVHPAERASLYEATGPAGGRVAVLGGDADPAVSAADAIVTVHSGLSTLAAQLGIPVVLLEPRPVERFGTYEVGWPRASDAASLRAQLLAISAGRYDLDALRARGRETGGPPDGRAGERVAALVQELAKGRA